MQVGVPEPAAAEAPDEDRRDQHGDEDQAHGRHDAQPAGEAAEEDVVPDAREELALGGTTCPKLVVLHGLVCFMRLSTCQGSP